MILIVCVICAATLMSGCMESAEPENQPSVPPTVAPSPVPTVTQSAETDVESMVITMPETPTSSVPENYYNVNPDNYFVDHKLYNHLTGYTWNSPLVRGAGWGLPEIAEMEHYLTEKGCNVTIRVADCSTTIDHTEFAQRTRTDGYARSGCLPEMDQYTEWLMIELNGEMVAYNVYGSYWAFKPESSMKDEYVSGGKWHDWWYYEEGHTFIHDGNTWTLSNFRDFDDIYALEDYFLSGDARNDSMETCNNGMWCSYCRSDDYIAADEFMIRYGWWMTEEEEHATERRINEATDWFELLG